MAVITGILITSLFGMSLCVQWTFQKWDDFSSSSNKPSPLYISGRDQIIRCCGVCGGMAECKSVVLNNDHCICSSEVIPYASQVDENTSVYVKGPKSCFAPGYIFVNNVCMMVSTDNKTWHEAKLDCENTGGNLIILDSPEKHQRVFDALSQYFDNPVIRYFVGASDIELEGNWKWINENASNYMHNYFFNDQYPNGGLGADCGTLKLTVNGIVDNSCEVPQNYIMRSRVLIKILNFFVKGSYMCTYTS